jgi:hypothetical protein
MRPMPSERRRAPADGAPDGRRRDWEVGREPLTLRAGARGLRGASRALSWNNLERDMTKKPSTPAKSAKPPAKTAAKAPAKTAAKKAGGATARAMGKMGPGVRVKGLSTYVGKAPAVKAPATGYKAPAKKLAASSSSGRFVASGAERSPNATTMSAMSEARQLAAAFKKRHGLS